MLGWYLLLTKPRQEELALQNLQQQGYCCYMPRMQQQKIAGKQLKLIEVPLFPRYIFVELDSSGNGKSWAPLRSTYGVSTLVRFGEQPAVVGREIITELKRRESTQGVITLFNSGDRVTIVDGPLMGIEGVFQMQDAEQRCLVLLHFLQRRTLLRIDPAVLRKIS